MMIFRKTERASKIPCEGIPGKGDPVGEIIRKLVVIISFIVLVGCVSWLLSIFIQGQSNAKVYDELSDKMKQSETTKDDWSSIYEKYPNVQFPSGMQTKFADLYATNPDIVGWLKIDGLGIDYPVVQTTDDAYYLKHDFMRNKSDYGTVFLSSGNNAKDLDLNNVVYGHTMRRDNQMFTPLKEYKTLEGFKKNQSLSTILCMQTISSRFMQCLSLTVILPET